MAWAVDATEASRDANRPTVLPRRYQDKVGREWDITTTSWGGWSRGERLDLVSVIQMASSYLLLAFAGV